MLFRILIVNSEKIYYSFEFYQEIERIFEYREELVLIIKEKHLDYLFAVLQVTKALPVEIREQILYRYLISEFRESYFIDRFEHRFLLDLDLFIELDNIDNLSDPTNYSLDSFYYYSD